MEDKYRPHSIAVTPNQGDDGDSNHTYKGHVYTEPVDRLGGSDHVDVDPDRIPDRVGDVDGKGPASRIRLLVYDDYLKSPTSKDLVSYSYTELDNILGLFDQLAFHVVAGDAIVGGTQPLMLALQVEHSADGINWLLKGAAPEIALTTILTKNGATPTTVVLPPGYDNGSTPSLAFVRVRMNLKTSGTGSAAPMSAKIKVWVTCNDRHEARFSEEQRHKWVKRIKEAVKAIEKKHAAEVKKLAQEKREMEALHKAKVDSCVSQYLALGEHDEHGHHESRQGKLQKLIRRVCAAEGVSTKELWDGVGRARAKESLKETEEAQKRKQRKAEEARKKAAQKKKADP